MAYDEGLAERLRDSFAATRGVSEKKMFGGIAFILNGNMYCGIVDETLMVRVGPDQVGERFGTRDVIDVGHVSASGGAIVEAERAGTAAGDRVDGAKEAE